MNERYRIDGSRFRAVVDGRRTNLQPRDDVSLTRRRWICLVVILVSVHAVARAANDPWEQTLVPFLGRYCGDCHSGDEPSAGIDFLSAASDRARVLRNHRTWERALGMLARQQMPPASQPQPTDAERERVRHIIATALDATCRGEVDPGRVTLRRLNRTEYQNAVEDLFGFRYEAAGEFPADDVGYGFDNIGDVLSLSPLLFEKYLDAAEKITRRALPSDPAAQPRSQYASVRDALLKRPSSDEAWETNAQDILVAVGSRAFRRPLRKPELRRLLDMVVIAGGEGRSFEDAVQVALQAILISPYFLFHVVEDPPITTARPETKRDDRQKTDQGFPVEPLNGFELASRLAFFLWSRPPDDELFEIAGTGGLRDPTILEAQVLRLLHDDRALALAENFAAQWLQLRRLESLRPDPTRFPAVDAALRRDMRRETELFFDAIARGGGTLLDLLDSDFSFVNAKLAAHYGVDGVDGEAFRRVRLAGTVRGGLITHASVLTLTSNPTRTSPVKRGKWILEQILGTPPPPPPPLVKELDEDDDAVAAATLRERLEQHRADPACASCHEQMDPLGFALENFDAVGVWRERDGKFPIDASGTLPDGAFVNGPRDLKALLTQRPRDFARALAEKMLTYALGRGLEYYDYCALERIVAGVESADYRFSQLVLEISKSVPFQMRRGRRISE